jgi:hypothetical protein
LLKHQIQLPIISTYPLSTLNPESLTKVILGMDAWLETMRGASGYGGPVSHWWQDCLHYTAAGLDWRYEGIIGGYLNLFERTGQMIWLSKACQAGNDLVAGQLPNSNYQASSFEANPKTGGTPHEAACDLALIKLSQVMRTNNISGWESYAHAAEHNIRNYILDQLWAPESGYFRNLVGDPVFVPNKAAMIVQALSAWVDFSDEQEWLGQCIFPTLDRICSCQMLDTDSRLNGAIDQSVGDKKREGWFFPYYNARCIPALIIGYRLSKEDRYMDAASAAMDFILRVQYNDGSFPQAIRANRRVYKYPQWVAGVGDILCAMSDLEAYSLQIDKTPTLDWMLQGLLPTGGMRTAHGFARKTRWPRWTDLPDFRDLLAVTGWVDKAFHFLTSLVGDKFLSDEITLQSYEQPCQYHGQICTYYEDKYKIEVHRKDKVFYRWQKGADWADFQ